MSRHIRPWAALPLAVLAAVAVAACGGSSKQSTSASSGGSSPAGGSTQTVSLVEGTFPQSLDPGKDYTSQGFEVNWVVYTGLTTYKHADAPAGGQLIPGLATALPKISDGGRTYTATLRKGLKYSNGAPVKASDFVRSVERAVTIPWGGAGAFITPVIQGASAFSTHKAKTISGITADNATGKITIHLVKPYGPFDNVLAFPCLGLVPSSTPLALEASNPPPGVGPYKVTNITPGQSYDVVKNPDWKPIPGIPSGHVNIDVKASSNISSNALAVLNNTTDVFDWADAVPGSLLAQINAKASDRFKNVNLGGSTYYIFFNVTKPPFNNQLVREAVSTGLNETAMNKLSSGTLRPACFFLAPAVPGHVTGLGSCPYGNPAAGGNIAKAKQLIKQSGQAGAKVTVWSETRDPRQQWMTYYVSFLNSIGLKASIKVLGDANYFTTIGTVKLEPDTGFADWNEDFPNPVDFYLLVDGNAIQPTDNQNYGQVNDPKINAAIAKLGAVPTPQLSSVASQWQATDRYLAKKAYIDVFGYQTFPFFMSDRMNYAAAVKQPIYGWDFTSFQLK